MSDLIDRQMVIDAVLRVAQTCPAEFENSGDAKMGYIAAIQSIYHEFKAISPAQPEPIYCRDCRNWEQINKALSARPVYGHWVEKRQFFTLRKYLECSKCGCAVDPNYISVYPDFCPGCGADMRWYD